MSRCPGLFAKRGEITFRSDTFRVELLTCPGLFLIIALRSGGDVRFLFSFTRRRGTNDRTPDAVRQAVYAIRDFPAVRHFDADSPALQEDVSGSHPRRGEGP